VELCAKILQIVRSIFRIMCTVFANCARIMCAIFSPMCYIFLSLKIRSLLGCDLHRLISLMFCPSACQLSAVVSFRLLVLMSGTAY